MNHRDTSCLFFLSLIFFSQSLFALTEKPIVVVIPSYNNAQWYKWNLDSVFSQEYKNYRVLYIDDCSTDGTYEKVKEYVAQHGQEHRVTLIRNEQNYGAMYNHYQAVHSCADHEIVFNLDGDDAFAHSQVMQRVNKEYQDPDCWLTYGQYEGYPEGTTTMTCRKVPKVVIDRNLFREYDDKWRTSHLRTFYARLFKEIELRDLLDDGIFFSTCADMALMLPMLEMAGHHSRFISDVVYRYNQGTPLNDFRVHLISQLRAKFKIRSMRKYRPLSKLFKNNNKDERVDFILVTTDEPQHIRTFLLQLVNECNGVGDITVLYEDISLEYNEDVYDQLKKEFPRIRWYEEYEYDDLRDVLLALLQDKQRSRYIALVNNSPEIAHSIDFTECVRRIEQTHAYAFYPALGKNITENFFLDRRQKIPKLVPITDEISAWQFKYGEFDWRTPHMLNGTVYRKQDLYTVLHDLDFDSIDELRKAWSAVAYDVENVGLCFNESKIVSVVERMSNQCTGCIGYKNSCCNCCCNNNWMFDYIKENAKRDRVKKINNSIEIVRYEHLDEEDEV